MSDEEFSPCRNTPLPPGGLRTNPFEGLEDDLEEQSETFSQSTPIKAMTAPKKVSMSPAPVERSASKSNQHFTNCFPRQTSTRTHQSCVMDVPSGGERDFVWNLHNDFDTFASTFTTALDNWRVKVAQEATEAQAVQVKADDLAGEVETLKRERDDDRNRIEILEKENVELRQELRKARRSESKPEKNVARRVVIAGEQDEARKFAIAKILKSLNAEVMSLGPDEPLPSTVTHVIACSLTPKVIEALLTPGVLVVSRKMIEDSGEHGRWMDESKYQAAKGRRVKSDPVFVPANKKKDVAAVLERRGVRTTEVPGEGTITLPVFFKPLLPPFL